ncbi:MAG: alpha/beta hydrolase [Bacteroidota bacterium]
MRIKQLLFSFALIAMTSSIFAQINPINSPYNGNGLYPVTMDSIMNTTPADVLIFKPSSNLLGPYPTILFQPGANSSTPGPINKHTYDLYWRTVASYGYVVIIINNTSGGPNSTLFTNTHNWIKDSVNNNPNSKLHGYVDLTKFVVAGHSNGGMNATDIIINRPSEIAGIVYMASYANPGIFGFGAQNVGSYTGKVLMMCGNEDATTVPGAGTTNATAKTAYDTRFTSASCKTWVLLDSVGHGGFGDYVNTAQPVGTIGRAKATGSVRHFLVAWLQSQFNSNSTAFDNMNIAANRPWNTKEYLNTCGAGPTVCGDPYKIGHSVKTFTDPSRANRAIETHIYYPAATAGDDVAVGCPSESTTFPVIVFGHGASQTYLEYQYLKDGLVPQGYIVCMVNTETDTPPATGAHLRFAQDMKFVRDQMQTLGADAASIFNTKVMNKTAIMGHSMGGGCNYLAAAQWNGADCMINFAAAETRINSAIDTAHLVTIPSLVISGSDDCVAPADSNQIPLWCNLGTPQNQKYFVSIIGGNHCKFSESGQFGACTLAETLGGTCATATDPAIDGAAQKDAAIDLSLMFLNWKLKGVSSAGTKFADSLATSTRIRTTINCPVVGVGARKEAKISMFPNPAQDLVNIEVEGCASQTIDMAIRNIYGQVVANFIIDVNSDLYNTELNIHNLNSGTYFIEFNGKTNKLTQKLIVY